MDNYNGVIEQWKLSQKVEELTLNKSITKNHYFDDDDIQNSLKKSSQKDERINELLRKIPSQIRQMYDCLGPVYEINHTYQIIYQNDGSIYFGQGVEDQKTGTGIQIWPEQENIYWMDKIDVNQYKQELGE